jgi:geranylgeranyl reductase family protein
VGEEVAMTTRKADVAVVGAGPAGSTVAAYLARTGLDVVVLEKSAFPREKVCGDGITPRGVRELVSLGVAHPESEGWIRNRGLRLVGRGRTLEIDWPDITGVPSYGLVRPRQDFDEILVQHARRAGATVLERHPVTDPVVDEASGRVVGVRAAVLDDAGRRTGRLLTVTAPVVVAADGNSSRLSLAVGLPKRDDRPLGVAVRTYYTSPRTHDDYLESWLELWDGEPRRSQQLPGYGWIFGVGDGTSNVGLGILSTSKAFGRVDYRQLLTRWLATLPPEWQYRDEFRVGGIKGAALPMGFNRTPHYHRGVMLVGDAGGMVNPFNGEGIAYAMASARMAADVAVQALAKDAAGRERTLAAYPRAVSAELGQYYAVGRVFVRMIGDPRVMSLLTRIGMPNPAVMRLAVKLLANMYEPRGGDAVDRLLATMTRLAPARADRRPAVGARPDPTDPSTRSAPVVRVPA